MAIRYHEYRSQSNHLSNDPGDAGLRIRLSGDLLLAYSTARANPDADAVPRRRRSKIIAFTLGTGNRMGRYLRECKAQYRFMHTLTYPSEYPSCGTTVKYHLRRYCQELMRITRRNKPYDAEEHGIFWFIEFQKRGAPHFHLLTTDFYSFKRCQLLWFAIVNSGDLKHLSAGVRVETLKKGKKGMISYARKYARKQEQKEVPENYENVGRFYGVYGNKKRVAAATTFYVDSCRKAYVLSIKDNVLSTINTLIVQKRLRLLKSDFGFRMFHVEQQEDRLMLMALLNSSSVDLDSFEYVACHDIPSEDNIRVPVLTKVELRQAALAYLRAKWGEADDGVTYK